MTDESTRVEFHLDRDPRLISAVRSAVQFQAARAGLEEAGCENFAIAAEEVCKEALTQFTDADGGLEVTLETFPEVPDVLRQLQRAGRQTAILSNGSPKMLSAAVRGANLEGLLDAVLSVEEAGVYKPHPRVYQLAVDRFAVPAHSIAFQSSNAWDAYAASAFGMQVVWCNRYGQRSERLPGAPDREVTSLADLPALVGAA